MGNQNFSHLDALFSDLGTEFSPELREKELGSSMLPLGDSEPPPGLPAPGAAAAAPDEGYDIDALLGELDGEGFTPDASSGAEYLDLGSPAEPAAPLGDDFAAFKAAASEPAEPAGPEGLDALLGDFAAKPAPAPAAAPAAAPAEELSADGLELDDLLEPPLEEPQADDSGFEESAVPPPPADDEMAAFLEDLGAMEAGEALPGGDEDFLGELEEEEAPAGEDFLAELESGDTNAPEEGAPGADDFLSDFDGGAPPEDDFLSGLEEGGGAAPGEEMLAAGEDASLPADDDLFSGLDTDTDAGFGEMDALDGLEGVTPATSGLPLEEGQGEEELDLTDDDLVRIQKRILILTPELQDRVRRAIVEASLPPASLNMLVRMLLAQRTPQEIREFLERETGERIVESAPEDYTGAETAYHPVHKAGKGLEHILPALRIGALLGGIFILGVLLFLLVIKPGIDARNSYRQGLTEISRGNWADAEKHFKKGEDLGGKDIDWYARYGLAYRERKEYAWAIRKFQDGLKIQPRHLETWMLLGETYAMNKDFGKARAEFEKLQRAYPENLRVLEKIGDLYVMHGDNSRAGRDEATAKVYYETAENYYEKILKLDWDDLRGQFKMLRVYVRKDEERRVRLKLDQIERISAGALDVPIYTEVAEYFQQKADWFKSRDLLKSVLARDGRYALGNYFMGRFYQEKQDWPRAELHLNRAISADDSDPRFHNDLGEVLMSYPEPRQALALKSFERARELDINVPDSSYWKPYVNLGFLYYEKIALGDQGDLKLLDESYNKALNNFQLADVRLAKYATLPRDFDITRFYYYYGWLRYKENRLQDALELWNKVYINNPFHPVFSFAIGNAFLHLGKDDLAIPEYQKNIMYYDRLAKKIPEINPANNRHRAIIQGLSFNYNNIGVAFLRKAERTGDPDWERQALQSFYRARELGDKLNLGKDGDNDFFWHNINVILKPERKLVPAIAPERMSKEKLPRFLDYPKP